jgi:hypothetical protein
MPSVLGSSLSSTAPESKLPSPQHPRSTLKHWPAVSGTPDEGACPNAGRRDRNDHLHKRIRRITAERRLRQWYPQLSRPTHVTNANPIGTPDQLLVYPEFAREPVIGRRPRKCIQVALHRARRAKHQLSASHVAVGRRRYESRRTQRPPRRDRHPSQRQGHVGLTLWAAPTCSLFHRTDRRRRL